MLDISLICVGLIAGYVASAYTWQTVKVVLNGEMAEAAKLRAKAADLETKLRGL